LRGAVADVEADHPEYIGNDELILAVSLSRVTMKMAQLTSPAKEQREWAKEKIRFWVKEGRKICGQDQEALNETKLRTN